MRGRPGRARRRSTTLPLERLRHERHLLGDERLLSARAAERRTPSSRGAGCCAQRAPAEGPGRAASRARHPGGAGEIRPLVRPRGHRPSTSARTTTARGTRGSRRRSRPPCSRPSRATRPARRSSIGGAICDARFSKCCGGMTEGYRDRLGRPRRPVSAGRLRRAGSPAGFDRLAGEAGDAERWILSSPARLLQPRRPGVPGPGAPRVRSGDARLLSLGRSPTRRRELGRSSGRASAGPRPGAPPSSRSRAGPPDGSTRLRDPGGARRARRRQGAGDPPRALALAPLQLGLRRPHRAARRRWLPARLRLIGAGWGHGVGLCQIGAASMADAGETHERILGHYFRGANQRRCYS